MNSDQSNRSGARELTRTGVFIALLVALQWLTAPLGQYITGSCVNTVLAVAALTAGSVWISAAVAVLSPVCAFLLGIGPRLIQIIPAIAAGNLLYVILMHFLLGTHRYPIWWQAACLILSAGLKAVSLYLLVNWLILPLMGDALQPQQAALFSAMFSWPQLVTALVGGCAALLIAPAIRKAVKK